MLNKPFAIAIISLMVMVSCKKDDKSVTVELDANFRQHNADSRFQRDEVDQADKDINDALKDVTGFGKTAGVTAASPMCGATIDSSQIGQKIIYFNFDGVTPCFSPSRTRSGQIKVQLTSGSNWSDQGAILTVTFIDFKVTRLSDNKFVKFNGIKTLQNINGHNWLGVLAGSASHLYRERAFGINVEFNNNLTAVWNSARRTTWTYTPAGSGAGSPKFNFTCTGDTAINNIQAVDSWGVNRFGNNFITNYTSPWSSNTYCGLWRPVSGSVTHRVAGSDYILDLGVDQNGNPTPYNCAYGYKVTWNNGTSTVIVSY